MKNILTTHGTISYESSCEITSEGLNVLFIHGNSLGKKAFENLKINSKDNWNFLSIDLPGHGDSGPFPKDIQYSVPEFVHTLVEFIENLKLQNIVLVGHSLGGHVAIDALEKCATKLIKGLVLIDTPPISSSEQIPQAFGNSEFIAELFNPELNSNVINQIVQSFFPNYQLSGTLQSQLHELIKNTDPRVRQDLGLSVNLNLIADEIKIVQESPLPKLIFQGEKDTYINQAYLETLKFTNLWKNQIIKLDGGHLPFIDDRSRFTDTLEEFLRSISLR